MSPIGIKRDKIGKIINRKLGQSRAARHDQLKLPALTTRNFSDHNFLLFNLIVNFYHNFLT